MKRTVLQMLFDAEKRYAEKPFVQVKGDGGWIQTSYREAAEASRCFARSLVRLGLSRNDTVAILSEGSENWVIGELGVLLAGCISVPLSIKLLPEEIPFRINHSESKAILVSRNTIERVLSVWDKMENGNLVLIYLDTDPSPVRELAAEHGLIEGKGFLVFRDMMEAGRGLTGAEEQEVARRIDKTAEDDVVTICYTSGTTGNPKGIMLTHLNYFANCRDSVTLFDIPEGYRTLLILPCDHSFAHTVGIYAALFKGILLSFVDSRGGAMATLRNIPININETDPDFLLTVPALSGNFMKKIVAGVEEKGGFALWLFRKGLRAGIRYHGNGFNRPPFITRLFAVIPYRLADSLVFSRVRKMFGTRLKFCVGGGALLDVKQQEFFSAIGMPIFQGYGLTEAAPVISSNTIARHKFGSSGIVAPTVTCRILRADDTEARTGETGEIVIKGENVMKGYFKNPEATAKTIRDGWLYTGDLGYFDRDGFLVVVGREKALLISEDGEKYSPEEIEEAIMNCGELIQQVMIYCDHRKYTSALIVPENDKVKRFISQNGVTDPQILLHGIKDSLDRFKYDPAFKGKFPGNWTPSTYQILIDPFTEQNRMINSSMKMVRFKITEVYKDLLDYMYTPDGRNYCNDRNRDAVRTLYGIGE